MTVIRVNSAQERALKLLASSPHGSEQILIRGHGFSSVALSSLARRRLATRQSEVVQIGGKAIEVVRLRITVAGRRAIDE